MHLCHTCKQEIEVQPDIPVGRQDTCPNCLADLKCCMNCRFHDPGRQNECMEPFAPFIRKLDKGNFCHFFKYGESTEVDDLEVMDARARLEDMFKNLK